MMIYRIDGGANDSLGCGAVKNTAVALGRFDAIHIGHMRIIKKTVEYARKHSLAAAVFMFDNDPTEVILGNSVPNVTSREKREEILKDLGVDIIIEKKFDSEFMRLSCREFVQKYLNDLLGARYAAAGFNYRFGKGGEGDVETLAKLCGEFGITTETVGEVTLGGKTVSSSRIRAAVADGDVESAAQMLGRFFSISGTIVKGNHIGKSFGFATANIPVPDNGIVPKTGVYISVAKLGGKEYSAITNVGSRPTVGEPRKCIETHIDGEFGDLYGERIEVEFCRFIREIKNFNSVSELAAQLTTDREKSREYYKELSHKGGFIQ